MVLKTLASLTFRSLASWPIEVVFTRSPKRLYTFENKISSCQKIITSQITQSKFMSQCYRICFNGKPLIPTRCHRPRRTRPPHSVTSRRWLCATLQLTSISIVIFADPMPIRRNFLYFFPIVKPLSWATTNAYAITVCFTDLDHGSEILSRFSLPKSMKHPVPFSAPVCFSVQQMIAEQQPPVFKGNYFGVCMQICCICWLKILGYNGPI